MTSTPAKIDLLTTMSVSHMFDADVADYIYDKMRSDSDSPKKKVDTKNVNARGKMLTVIYYLIRFFWFLTGKPSFIGDRLCAFYRSTALHNAVLDGNIRSIQWLLENGWDPSMKTHEGETALEIAQRLGYWGIHKLLERIPT